MSHEDQSGQCLVCKEQAKRDGLCNLHHLAREKLDNNYKLWQAAYGDITYERYLQSLIRLPETGEAAATVAKLILNKRGGETVEDTRHL